jgi:hypothetical protein
VKLVVDAEAFEKDQSAVVFTLYHRKPDFRHHCFSLSLPIRIFPAWPTT